MDNLLELYQDYLMTAPDKATATGLSSALDNIISHDKFTRLLAGGWVCSKLLWEKVKPITTEISSNEGVLILDDSICEKAYMEENKLVCWHYDHVNGRSVKGINFLTALYHSNGMSVPLGIEFVEKPVVYKDEKTGKLRRKSLEGKNILFRRLVTAASRNVGFRYVLSDSWFCNSGNMKHINGLEHNFIMAIKPNFTAAFSKEEKEKGRFKRIDEIGAEGCTVSVWLKGLDFPVLLTKLVFKDEGGVTGTLYLVSNDLSLTSEQMATIYKKRWKVETYHKTLKSYTALAKSQAQLTQSQKSHFIAALIAFVKWETLKSRTKQSHEALKLKLHLSANKAALCELERLYTAKAA